MKKVCSPLSTLYSLLSIFKLVRNKNYRLWILACSFWFVIASVDNSAFSQNFIPSLQAKRMNSCSEQTLEALTTQMLRDLPSYANRASQRARRLSRSSDVYSYVLLAGRPEFQPLPLNPEGYTTDRQKSATTGVEQVFFTTLERQYINQKAVELQEFHWLLLTKTKNGWRLVMMFTQTDSYPVQQPASPPRDSSNGNIAQGIKTWLRDCQAGSVRTGAIGLK
ncbi:hypothetical protein I8752_10435 [Nostocaceae cyanobacterium CENA369]|uniref:Uncharacterized protein n=2 Tax=Dendronalium TaxID=2840442 RepID=A0A8J7I4M2_9NOST|nr:hypothetical protein [Dendronalium phyllosphericum CENA369]